VQPFIGGRAIRPDCQDHVRIALEHGFKRYGRPCLREIRVDVAIATDGNHIRHELGLAHGVDRVIPHLHQHRAAAAGGVALLERRNAGIELIGCRHCNLTGARQCAEAADAVRNIRQPPDAMPVDRQTHAFELGDLRRRIAAAPDHDHIRMQGQDPLDAEALAVANALDALSRFRFVGVIAGTTMCAPAPAANIIAVAPGARLTMRAAGWLSAIV